MPTKTSKKKPAKQDLPGQTNFIEEQDRDDAEHARRLTAADAIRDHYQLVRVQTGRLPDQRKLKASQKKQLADSLGADANAISASRKLWNAKEEAVKKFRAVLGRIEMLKEDPWHTLPHVEPGCRLIRTDKIPEFDRKIEEVKLQLAAAARELRAELPRIIERRRAELGDAFNEADYQLNPEDLAYVQVRYLQASIPDYLTKVAPEIAAREMQLIRDEFAEIAAIKEAHMAELMFKMVDELTERLTSETGEKKTFRDDTVNKLFDAIDQAAYQAGQNHIGGPELSQAFNSLKQALGSQRRETLPAALRTSEGFRDEMRKRLEKVGEQVLSLSVLKPRRAILRQKAAAPVFKATA